MTIKKNTGILKKEYFSITLHNFKNVPQINEYLTANEIFEIEVIGQVLPFKTNNYIVDELIHWDNYQNDPIFTLTFPRKNMLKATHYNKIAELMKAGASKREIDKTAVEIRTKLNPNPAGQGDLNVPMLNNRRLKGMQHKYGQTTLFFPSQGQTCHAYCTFCFRWSQFVGLKEEKFAMKEVDDLIAYIKENTDITDLLFTGGDPMVMKSSTLSKYIDTILNADISNLQTIRIGTKSLGFWPYRFLTDDDSEELLNLFNRIRRAGKHLAIMAHFSHPNELKTPAVKLAIKAIRKTGAQIRTQSPIFKHINDHPDIWADMWKRQVKLGCIPYYMFIARDTGAQHYFALPLIEAWTIFRKAYRQVSGIARTVRGPSMSCTPGKIHIVGVADTSDEKVMILKFIQGRNPEWVGKPFFAKFNPKAIWIDELVPAFEDGKFFFEDELQEMAVKSLSDFRLSDE
ncbi:MAG: 4Fe-4S cluster-binding domain-containing protein [Bacteroidales bacterium]|nr:4Fe-4S cluster-binding domain-containing protein [Bacteroidales bacterium]